MKPVLHTIHKLIRTLVVVFIFCSSMNAQTPFVTDDAEATAKHKFHFEFGNEFDVLQRSEYPALRQNTAGFELSYGLFDNVEIGFGAPLLAISHSHIVTPQTLFGMSDAALHVKYNFYKEREGSKLPAMAISGVIQLPTGEVNKELGTGLFNYYVNGILEKSVTSKTAFRLNGGILFAGSDQSGELGIKTRGRVFTASGSLVKQVTSKLDFGAELSGAVTSNFNLSEGRLQAVVGGNYLVRKNMTLDFGISGGKFAASPRLGLILGVSIDLQRPSEQH